MLLVKMPVFCFQTYLHYKFQVDDNCRADRQAASMVSGFIGRFSYVFEPW